MALALALAYVFLERLVDLGIGKYIASMDELISGLCNCAVRFIDLACCSGIVSPFPAWNRFGRDWFGGGMANAFSDFSITLEFTTRKLWDIPLEN